MARMHNTSWQLIALTAVLVCGCQHNIVQKGANRIAGTVPNLYYEQVLDNVARTMECPSTLPYFGVPAQATHTNSRQLSATYTPGFDLVAATTTWLFDKQTAAFAGQAQNQESIQLQPVINPDRIFLMQLAYWKAIGYSPDPTQTAVNDYTIEKYYELTNVYNDYNPYITGDWFRVTKSRKEAIRCGCYCAKCGDKYIYVPPECMQDFSMFTLGILDIATIDTEYFYGAKTFPDDSSTNATPAGDGSTSETTEGTKRKTHPPRKRIKRDPLPPPPVAPNLN